MDTYCYSYEQHIKKRMISRREYTRNTRIDRELMIKFFLIDLSEFYCCFRI